MYKRQVYTKYGTESWSDDFYYLNAIEKIANGNWNITYGESNYLIVGPSLPLLGALFLKLSNNVLIPFFIYNIVVTSLMVPVLYYFAKEVFNEKVGWLIVIWGVFFIEAYKYSPHILKEPTLFLFVPLTLLFLVKAIKSEDKRIINIFFASLSFMWLIHTDERYFVYLPVFTLFFLLIKPLHLSIYLKTASLWISFLVLLMLPWGIRNYLVFDQIVILTPRTTAITYKFWGENLASIASHFSDEKETQKIINGRYENALEFGKRYNITPRQYGELEARIRAFINFWQPTYFTPTFIQYGYRSIIWSFKHNAASLLFYGMLLPFYIVGFFVLIKQKHHFALVIALIPFIHSLMHAYMVWPLERYRSPVTFIVVMIGIYVILELINKTKINFFRGITVR